MYTIIAIQYYILENVDKFNKAWTKTIQVPHHLLGKRMNVYKHCWRTVTPGWWFVGSQIYLGRAEKGLRSIQRLQSSSLMFVSSLKL